MSLRKLITAAVVAPALALIPVAANAAIVTTHDAEHDVMSMGAEDDDITTPEPLRAEGDVLKMRVNHRANVVRVTLFEKKITRAHDGSAAFHLFALRTNEGKRAELSLIAFKGRLQGLSDFAVRGKQTKCRGVRTYIDYANDNVQVSIPRRCLSNPRWVQVGAGTGSISDEGEDSRIYADDANLDAQIRDDIAFGPRVRRG